jgi:hypothetical protein
MSTEKYKIDDLLKIDEKVRLVTTNIMIANELNQINKNLKELKNKSNN